MSDLVGNPEERFSWVVAEISLLQRITLEVKIVEGQTNGQTEV